jgi:hypothetical protein
MHDLLLFFCPDIQSTRDCKRTSKQRREEKPLGPTTTSSNLVSLRRNSGDRDVNLHRTQSTVRPHRFKWLDILIAVCAAGGLTASVLFAVQVRTNTFAVSDFKTLYASVWCFAHKADAYSLAKLQQVFSANGVIQPEWYGHAPVYPWMTLALLSPLAVIGMVPAAYLLTLLSGALIALAIAALMRYAATDFDMPPVWRVFIAAACASGPLLAFGMDMGNVSVVAIACCLLAFVRRRSGSPWTHRGSSWMAGAALAIALLLKPHLGFWVAAGMFFLPERAARAVVVRAVALAAGFALLTAAVMAATGTLAMETRSYLAMLSAETSAGSSMNATSREVIPVVAQITSLESILGFWIANPAVRIGVTCSVLLALGIFILRQTRRVNTERGALLAVGAWCALGMLATYHRAHDAALLLLLVPWVVDRVRRTPLVWHAWAVVAFYCAMSVSANFATVQGWLASLPTHSVAAFVLLRQAGLADCLVLVALVLALRNERMRQGVRYEPYAELDPLQAAA